MDTVELHVACLEAMVNKDSDPCNIRLGFGEVKLDLGHGCVSCVSVLQDVGLESVGKLTRQNSSYEEYEIRRSREGKDATVIAQ